MHFLKKNFVIIFLMVVPLCIQAETPKRVLFLDSYGRDVAPFNHATRVFRSTLAQELGEPVDLYEASLDAARFAEPEKEAPFIDYIKSRFQNRSVDLVVPFGSAAALFALKHRDALFPNTPIEYVALDPRLLPPSALQTNAALVAQRINLPGIIEDILQLRPDTTNIAFVMGSAPVERFWTAQCRHEFMAFTNRVSFTWLNEFPLDQIKKRVASLPARSFILYSMFVIDAGGVPWDNDEALERIHDVANAPIYGYFQSQVGLGAVGGHLYQDSEVGIRAARVAIRILHGEKPEGITPQIIDPVTPVYDMRELKRWNIKAANLPANRTFQFVEPSFWSLYRWRITGICLFILLQTALIVCLLISRANEHRAEVAARFLSRRLISAQEEERSRIARELHDDLTQRLARLANDWGRLAREPKDFANASQGMRQELIQISEDVHALSYQLHPSILEDLGLAEALRAEAEQFSQRESIPVKLDLDELPSDLSPNVGLGFYRITQEALRNIVRHAEAKNVELTLRKTEGELQLAVRDDGCGFDPSERRKQPGLGLASMRERAQLFQGRLEIVSEPGNGTIVKVVVSV